MPASMMSAPTGLRLNVIGSSIAIVATGPMPGSTPIRVPSRQPISAKNKLIGVTATPKPMIRLWKIWSIVASSAEILGPDREGQRQALHENKHREQDEDDEQDDHFLPLELVAARRADEDERRGSNDEAERLHQIAVGDGGGRHQHDRLGIRPEPDREQRYDERGAENCPLRAKADLYRQKNQDREDAERDHEIDDVERRVHRLVALGLHGDRLQQHDGAEHHQQESEHRR